MSSASACKSGWTTPPSNWKFNMDDLEARKQWKQYQKAYEDLLCATSTPWAPWTVVPADSKTHRNLMIATVVRASLAQLGLRFPPGDPAQQETSMTESKSPRRRRSLL
jgi:hypothetical protein